MNLTLLPALCQQTQTVVAPAAAFISSQAGKVQASQIEVKYKNNLVSYVDIEAEKILISGLKTLLPQANFLAEENTLGLNSNDYHSNDKNNNEVSNWQWVIDPLDGTTNFLYNLPVYAVSVGLLYQQKPVMGVVHEVVRNECFYAWQGGGAWCNGLPIGVSKVDNLSEALMATGFPYYNFELVTPYSALLQTLMKQTKGIRRFGAAAVDLCYVACGRFDAYFEHSLHPWDVAAGGLIVREAGGVVADFAQNTDNWLHNQQIVAANKAIWPNFMGLVGQYLNEAKHKQV